MIKNKIMANSLQSLDLHLRLVTEDILKLNNNWIEYFKNIYNKWDIHNTLIYANILIWLLHDLWKTSIYFQNRLNNNLNWKKEKVNINEYHNWWYLFFKDILKNFLEEKGIYIDKKILETICYSGSISILNHHFDLDNKSKISEVGTLEVSNWEASLIHYNWEIKENILLKDYIELLFTEKIINKENIKHTYSQIAKKTKQIKIKELSLFISKYNFNIDIFNKFWEENINNIFDTLLNWEHLKKDTKKLLFNNYNIDSNVAIKLLNFVFLPNLIFIDKKISIWLKENNFVNYKKNDNYLIKEYYNTKFPLDKSLWLNKLRGLFFNEINWNIDKTKKIHIIEAPAWIWKFLSLTSYGTQLMDENLHKVVYIAPFVSILDQNSNVLKEDILKKEWEINDSSFSKINYLAKKRYIINKNFAQIDNLEKEWFSYLEKYMLKWLNSKYVFTTFVNIFNSLFWFKNIDYVQTQALLNNSILIIDEIQDFNKENLYFLKYFLKEIVPYHNIKVILSSATLPKFIYSDLETDTYFYYNYYNNKHLKEENNKYFNRTTLSLLNNQNIDNINEIGSISYNIEDNTLYTNIISRFKNNKKILFINNTIKSSEELGKNILNKLWLLWKEWEILEDDNWEQYIYYFLNNKSKNKFEKDIIIDKIKNHNDNIRLLLFSTQLIKAGVDIDMDICFSDLFNLYDIIQIMGRVNRNNKRTFDNKLYLYALQNWNKMDYEKIAWDNDNNSIELFLKYINTYWLKNNMDEQYLYNIELKKFNDFINNNISIQDYHNIFDMLDYETIRKKSRLIKEKEWEISYIKDLENILFLDENDKQKLETFLLKILNTEWKNRNNIEIKLKWRKYSLQSFINTISEYELWNYNLWEYISNIKNPIYKEISNFII